LFPVPSQSYFLPEKVTIESASGPPSPHAAYVLGLIATTLEPGRFECR